MDPKLNEALTDVVRRWAKPTTPEELQRRGVSRVRSVSMRRVASLIEKAVNRTLIARTIGELPDDADAFSEATRMEFMSMLAADGPAQAAGHEAKERVDDRVGQRAQTALARLKKELAERREAVAQVEAEHRATNEDLGLERKLRQTFAAWGGDPNRPSPMEREVIALAVTELRAQRAKVEEAAIGDHQREIDLLERRIAKLNGLLVRTEEDLKRIVAQGEVDPGLASVYDEVQGLEDRDPMHAQKAALMESIFLSNLELREEMAS